MSGTSMDAVDVAIVDFNDRALLKHYKQFPLDETLKQHIRPLNGDSPLSDIARVDHMMGHVFADAVIQSLRDTDTSPEQIMAIGSHGQTVFHHPDKTWQTSIQLGDPNIICAKTGITTVADFRRMDMTLGGQGAPLAPAFHRFQFRDNNKNRTILNIGGIANITNLPADANADVVGFDTGPGNGLLDDWNYRHNQSSMDKDSKWALSGEINPELLNMLKNDPYFTLLPPKSTGREYFNLDWLDKYLSGIEQIRPNDVQATLLELSMETIAEAVQTSFPACEEIYVCGGGAKNPTMVRRLGELLEEQQVSATGQLGIDPDAVEAVTFAWLAYCRLNGFAIDLKSITGSKRKLLAGAVYEPAPLK